ncbi:quaternary ammonium compound efflux SMR transporter SugE [Mangrovimicrobium sediminis]|uniref:Guanidinium exporter n=1 Tax=Mangrovimicrobium sediminis TaxID=2562682 RepID=A0A4Z0M948_9GAMM|nr:quaternary ammonium compound efflux SMR transporter SugE [Haliea sp. SAOS-164]TGD76242.1 quaternary ammonium compound efflux SMR transporter SugE [Haliea sp. SAOS-164]
MAWVALFVAGLFEIIWALALKYSEGFTRLWPSVIFGVAAWLSFALLSYALKTIPMGNAYAIWTGIGAVGIALVGIFWLNESADFMRIACIILVVMGIAGLKISGSGSSIV